MEEINEKQKNLLQHTLGADSRYKKKQWGFRNHFCSGGEGDPNIQELENLERAGMLTSGDRFGSKTFWATEKGALAIGFKKYQLQNTNLA